LILDNANFRTQLHIRMNDHTPQDAAKNRHRSTHADKLRDAIEERCVSGALRPGTRLDETELARHFEVSRTPVREALIQLTSAGLATMGPLGRGVVVADVSPLRLLRNVRGDGGTGSAMRPAGRAADVRSRPGVASARPQSVRSHVPVRRPRAYFVANDRFHHSVRTSSHNGFLIDQAAAMPPSHAHLSSIAAAHPNRMRSSFEEHAEIVAALLSGDPDLSADRVTKARHGAR
jgi:DNA-binding GntR family transcriptional regulator